MVCKAVQPRATNPKENKNGHDTAAMQPLGCLGNRISSGEFLTYDCVLVFKKHWINAIEFSSVLWRVKKTDGKQNQMIMQGVVIGTVNMKKSKNCC